MKPLKKSVLLIFIFLATFVLVLPQILQAHCQIPCGIYDDFARVQTLREDAATVEKSTRLIMELAGKSDAQSQNQLIRWVMNKEAHAQKIISSISDYFLTQRVKPDQKDYAERLKKHHFVILAAMKAKQNADMSVVKSLKEAIEGVSAYYPAHKE